MLAYLFERFPSFGQTFCYREIAELQHQGVSPALFSIRRPTNEPAQEWDRAIVRDVHYLPDESKLLHEVERATRKGKLPRSAVRDLSDWGRKSDFLRLQQAAWLGLELQARGVKHVHVHFAGMAARTAYWVARFFGTAFSFTAHANDIFAPREFEISLGKLVQAAKAVVTVSDYSLEYLDKKFPGYASKMQRIYNGIELARFIPADFSSSRPRIISVGRLIEKKGFHDLLEACRLLHDKGHNFVCEIIGEGPLEESLQEQITHSGLTNITRLLGPLPEHEVIRRLAQSQVFALPCQVEADGGMDNLPTVLMEAMAAGLPIVATPIAGVPEMVVSEKTGFLVPENKPEQLATALERLMMDRALAQSFGAAGRLRAHELFSIVNSAQDLIRLFRRTGAI